MNNELKVLLKTIDKLVVPELREVSDIDFVCPYNLQKCGQAFRALLKYRDRVIELSAKNSKIIFFEDNSAIGTFAYCDCINCESFTNWTKSLCRNHGKNWIKLCLRKPDTFLKNNILLTQGKTK